MTSTPIRSTDGGTRVLAPNVAESLRALGICTLCLGRGHVFHYIKRSDTVVPCRRCKPKERAAYDTSVADGDTFDAWTETESTDTNV